MTVALIERAFSSEWDGTRQESRYLIDGQEYIVRINALESGFSVEVTYPPSSAGKQRQSYEFHPTLASALARCDELANS